MHPNIRHETWVCNVCQATNSTVDAECQFCECQGADCQRDNCADPKHFESEAR